MGTVTLPIFHQGQVNAFKLPARFKAIRCGRRWGKTLYSAALAADAVAKGEKVGFFGPDYKRISETYNEILSMLIEVKTSAQRSPAGLIRSKRGGQIDFWTLEDETAGRGRKYHRVFIDEAAFTKNATMMGIWSKAIRPTLLDYRGRCTVLSNTNGDDPENFFWRICNEPEHGFKEYHAPTHDNPFLPPEELVKLQQDNHPLVYAQEYLADFVSWAGVAFFALDKLLVNGAGAPLPKNCDAVFAVMDTATKTGKDNDSTGIVYCAYDRNGKYPLIILGWDVQQIEGASLEVWLPTVVSNLENYAAKVQARRGSLGVFIEDKDSGQILLQQAARKRVPAQAIPSTLTALGKDERAISVSGYVFQGKVKLSAEAYDKVSTLKNATRNHLVSQVTSFRVGDKDAAKRADDLLDAWVYSVAITLGNSEGF